MWEVFTEGRMPFEQNQNHEVVTLVTKGHRLYRPKMATPTIYDIMQLCWHEVRTMRNNLFHSILYEVPFIVVLKLFAGRNNIIFILFSSFDLFVDLI